jgi:hypothetical protein
MSDLFHPDAAALREERDRGLAALAQRQADAALKPKVEQEPCDHGLFGDQGQADLIERLRQN